jgi:predicted RNA-binding protein YlxR (DUF448 family)
MVATKDIGRGLFVSRDVLKVKKAIKSKSLEELFVKKRIKKVCKGL